MDLMSITFIFCAYLLGSLSSAILVCRLGRFPDPRSSGSGNPGATNVLRIAGKGPAVATLLGDVFKGFLPVVLAQWWFAEEIVWALTALAAFLGHLYPVFFRFRGGKGVATALGALLGASFIIGGMVLVTWLVVAFVWRISSLAAMVSAVAAPFYVIWFSQWHSLWVLAVTVLMSMLLLWRHQSNIENLLAGKEKRIGQS